MSGPAWRGAMICSRDCRVMLWVLGLCFAGGFSALAWHSDNDDGTFTNPVLYTNYPDPDIIRVGDDFYFAATTFVNVPGLTILYSQDLVNWGIVSHVILRLEGHPQYDLKGGSTYRAGVFAPSHCYSDGSFYVVTTPVGQKTRVYYAKDIRESWQHHELDREAFDPSVPRFPGGCRRPLPVPPCAQFARGIVGTGRDNNPFHALADLLLDSRRFCAKKSGLENACGWVALQTCPTFVLGHCRHPVYGISIHGLRISLPQF